jgi:cytochrome bd-type quinol oxidase subunit 2
MIGAVIFWVLLVPLMLCVVALAIGFVMLAAGWVLMRVALRLKRRARRLGDRGLARGFDRAAVALLVVSYPSARLYARLSDDVVDWENWTRFGELGVETRRRS